MSYEEESEEEEFIQIYPPEDAPSLLDCSMHTILSNIYALEPELEFLPVRLKLKLFNLMSKRGLVNDSNIKILLHKDILELDLTESSVTDESLLEIEKCKYLTKLDLNSMKKNRTDITSEKLERLLRSLQYLRVLYLRRCKFVDDRPICVAAKCQFLTELNLSGCVLVTDISVVALSKFAPELKCLNLSRTQVTDFGLLSLANGVCSKMLSELQVPYCENVTDEGISILNEHCPKLAILIFHGCPHISSDMISVNWQANPDTPRKMVTWTVH